MSQIPVTTLTATGPTPAVYLTAGLITVSGVFVGTINVQVDIYGDGTWVNAVDTTGTIIALTAPGSLKLDNDIGCLVRANCSAYTSGSIVVRIGGS